MRIRVVVLLLFLLLPAPTLAQLAVPGAAPDTATEEAALAVPTPASLGPGWWRYISTAEPTAQPERIEALLQAATTAVLSLRVEDGAAAAQSIDRFRAQLDALARLQTQAPQDVLPALRMEGRFTPDQLLAVVATRLDVERRVAVDSVEVAERRQALDRERRGLETKFTTYLDLDPASVERVRLGLEVMADRAAIAVLELRLQRQDARLAQLRSYLADLDRQRAFAIDQVTIEGLSPKAFETRVEVATAQAESAREAAATAETRLLGIAEDTPRARAEYRLVQQILADAQVREQLARVEVAAARSILAWLAFEGEGGSTGPLIEDLEQDRTLLAGLRARIEVWRAGASGLLLAPATLGEAPQDDDVQGLAESARERAQGVLRSVLDLEARIGQLNLVLSLMEERLADRQGGLRRWWLQSRLELEELYKQSLELLNRRMFLIGETPVTPGGLVRVVFILLLAFWISRALRHTLERLGRTRSFMNPSSFYTLGRLIHYVIMIGALLIALGSLGLDFSNLALIAGALSVGIGFGLQSIVSNFVAGLILLFDRSLKVGDYVELDSGLTGHVREINIRSTRINTNDNIDVLVPNSEFISKSLTNWTLRENMTRMRVPFGVAYGTDKELVRKLALEVADKIEFTLRNMPGKEPEVWLVGFGDSSLDFELLVWVSRAGVRRPGRVQATYLWGLHTAFEEHGIEIPFPQRDLHLRSGLEVLREQPTGPA